MKFCAIIPDRGDRKELTDFCFKQLERMTVKPDKVFHINHRPETEKFDLVHRLNVGINLARAAEMDWCLVIENDDSYPADYFERFIPHFESYDFIGNDSTTYYNLRNQTHTKFDHPYRSSLFNTAFRISTLNNFDWKEQLKRNNPFIDIALWQYARFKKRKFIDTGAIGIKHNLGLCGGRGHQMNMRGKDPDLSWLKANVDEMSFEFYKGMIEQFKTVAA